MPNNLPAMIFIALIFAYLVYYIIRLARRKYGRTKTAQATVINKQVVEHFSRYSGTGTRKTYHVTFLVNGKRKVFDLSEFSYNGFKIGESGTIKYKGTRLIDFH